MRIFVTDNLAVAPVVLDSVSINILPRIEGRKKWVTNGLQFEATPFNLRLFQEELGADIVDDRKEEGAVSYKLKYENRTPPLKHQAVALKKALPLNHFAFWMDVGTGKSWLAIYMMGLRFVNKLISGALIISPKGVNYQWINEQIPEHISPKVRWVGNVWDKKVSTQNAIMTPRPRNVLDIMSIHIDALDNELGNETLRAFLRKHAGRVMIIFDEADLIKNYKAIRTIRAMEFRDEARFRLQMTGTPAPKDLEDIWSEFNWLDPNIMGIKYVTSFRREFAIMGGFQMRNIVGYRDVARFKKMTDPYVYSITSEEVGVIPPSYVRWRFDMTERQRKAFDEIKKSLKTDIEQGKTLVIPDTGVKFLKLQQITSGFIVENIKVKGQKPTSKTYPLPNPRLEALMQVIEARNPKKAAIWCRFHYDLEQITKALPKGSWVEYSGRIPSDEARERAKVTFLDPKSGVRFFVATAGSGGVGLNLQGEARLAIYYTNTYKARERWQSEGRLSRLGAHGQVEIVDIICRNSTDSGILSNLRRKQNVQDLAKSDLIKVLDGEEEDYYTE